MLSRRAPRPNDFAADDKGIVRSAMHERVEHRLDVERSPRPNTPQDAAHI